MAVWVAGYARLTMATANQHVLAQALADEQLGGPAGRDELLVYADRLLASGDRRGELLILECEAIEDRASPHKLELELEREFAARCRALRATSGSWLSVEIPRWRGGLAVELDLAGPIGPQTELGEFLREPALALISVLRVELRSSMLESMLESLRDHAPPLTRLALKLDVELPPPESEELGRQAFDALPELRALTLVDGALISLGWLETCLTPEHCPQLAEFALLESGPRSLRVRPPDQHPVLELLVRSRLFNQVQRLVLPPMTIGQLRVFAPQLRRVAELVVPYVVPTEEDEDQARELLPQLELRHSMPLNSAGALERDRRDRPWFHLIGERTLIFSWPHQVEGRSSVWLDRKVLRQAIIETWPTLERERRMLALELLGHYQTLREDIDVPVVAYDALMATLATTTADFVEHLRCFELHRDCCTVVTLGP